MMFKRWFPRHFARHFQTEQYNFDIEEEIKGSKRRRITEQLRFLFFCYDAYSTWFYN